MKCETFEISEHFNKESRRLYYNVQFPNYKCVATATHIM